MQINTPTRWTGVRVRPVRLQNVGPNVVVDYSKAKPVTLDPVTFLEPALEGADPLTFIARWGTPYGGASISRQDLDRWQEDATALVATMNVTGCFTQFDADLSAKLPVSDLDAGTAAKALEERFAGAMPPISIRAAAGGSFIAELTEPATLAEKLDALAACWLTSNFFSQSGLCRWCHSPFFKLRFDAMFCTASCRSQHSRRESSS